MSSNLDSREDESAEMPCTYGLFKMPEDDGWEKLEKSTWEEEEKNFEGVCVGGCNELLSKLSFLKL